MIVLKLYGIPQSKQSARFYAKMKNGKPTVGSYQKSSVVDKNRSLALDAISQLPKGFKPFTGTLFTKAVFVFPVLKSMPKQLVKSIEDGIVVYKPTKPDLIDNCMKGVYDALNGIVYHDDSLICRVSTAKIYGVRPMTFLMIGDIEEWCDTDVVYEYFARKD